MKPTAESHRQRLTREYEETEKKIEEQKELLTKSYAKQVKEESASRHRCQLVTMKAQELHDLECKLASEAHAEVVKSTKTIRTQLNIHLDAVRSEIERSLGNEVRSSAEIVDPKIFGQWTTTTKI